MPDAPEKGLRQSPLKLNQGLGAIDTWDAAAIQDRAARLTDIAVGVWAAPSLAPDVLDAYRRKGGSPAVYTIEDHPHLLTASIRPLFDAFRKAVLALDPCVTEECLKQYVAYKAETNFVDVYPQAKRLRLILNLTFAEVNDSQGKCKDITGDRLNGDVEVGLSKLEELPYVIGLVRQSLEAQLGNPGDASAPLSCAGSRAACLHVASIPLAMRRSSIPCPDGLLSPGEKVVGCSPASLMLFPRKNTVSSMRRSRS